MIRFPLTIASTQGLVFEGEVGYVHLPGLEGEFGILAGHEPQVVALGPGTIRVSESSQAPAESEHIIDSGFAHIEGHCVTLLVRT